VTSRHQCPETSLPHCCKKKVNKRQINKTFLQVRHSKNFCFSRVMTEWKQFQRKRPHGKRKLPMDIAIYMVWKCI
jgi:hypothetical protein